jgi:hypothetical protein
MNGLAKELIKRSQFQKDSGGDTLARLIMAASEDAAFRKRLVFVLKLPQSQREPLMKTAVDEMRLRGEPPDARTAFLALSTEEGARTALQLLEEC